MHNLLSPDNTVMQLISKIAYSAYLNLLWIICSVPIFTIGASTTALFYTSLKLVSDDDAHITKAFFHSFRQNFKQGTIIWMILLGIGLIFGVDGYVLFHMRLSNVFLTILTAVFLVGLIAYTIILVWIFPLLSRFENTTKAMFKNSMMIGMRFLLCTFMMIAVYAVMAFVIIFVFTPAFIFGMGLCTLLCSFLCSKILILCETPESETEES